MPLKKIRGVWTYWGVEMDREALGIYKRVLNIWGIGGIRMVCRCMGASKHMAGVQIPQTYGGVKPMPWKKWFWTFSTLGGCGGRCGGLERTDFEQFLLWEGVVVLKELILNSFYFGRVWWSWKNWLWTVSSLGRCGSLERTDFEQFLLWTGVEVGVVVLKELILNSFYFGTVWWSWKNWFWTVSTLGGCGGLERTDFEQFLLWKGVEVGMVVSKELILNSFYFGRLWWSWKNSFWTVSTLGGCGGLESTDFEQFLLWDSVVVLTDWFWTVSTLGGCGGHESTDLNSFNVGKVWWS